MTRSDRWFLLGVFFVALVVGINVPLRAQTVPPFLIFGSPGSTSTPQVIKSTSNALWVSLQSVAAALTITRDNIVVTSTDGLIVTNTTAATGAVTVQMSPRVRFRGNAWDTSASQTVDFFVENLPATAATPTGTFKIGYSLNGAAATYPLTVSSAGLVTALGNFSTTGNLIAGSSGAVFIGSRGAVSSTADKLIQLGDNAITTAIEINAGTPTLGTCTGGSLTSGAHNSAGEVTGNTSGSCVINFGTPNFTNTPFCFINDETALIAVRISARSASSITVTGAGSGDAFQFFCIGRIGT